jgi:hypothetical protein
MIGLNRHPSWRDLNRLADDELEAVSRGAALKHVAACPKCSRELSLLQDLRDAGRGMRHPSPPRDLLDDILRDRAAGARVILPAVPPSSPRRRFLPAAAAAAIMAGLAGLATLTSEAGAGASELTVDPARPAPGEQIRVSYRPGSLLSGEATLRLRMRLRAPDAEPPRGTLGELDEALLWPDGDGRYVASFQLPPDFALASMAVENLAGDRLDDRGGRLWSVRAHAADGLPLPGALRQEFLVLQNRSWPEARNALREMTLLYPELAEGWSLDLSYERAAELPEETATRTATHREIFRRLQKQAEEGRPSLEEVAALVRYAAALEDADAHARWLERLESLDPAHRSVISHRLAGLSSEEADVDAYLEALWSAGARVNALYREGFQIALAAGDTTSAGRWAMRGLELEEDHLTVLEMARVLVSRPETRERGISAIRDLLAHIAEEAEEERPLDSTPADVHRESLQVLATLRVGLARQLLASGEPRAALQELDSADALEVWLPDLYRVRFEALLAVGNDAAARADFHRLDSDPMYSRESVDSLLQRLPTMSGAELRDGRSRASAEMVRRVVAGQEPPRGLPVARVRTPTGQFRSLRSLVAGRPTIVLFWDRRIFGSVDDVADVILAAQMLAGGPGQLLWITPEPDSRSLQGFTREEHLPIPAYQDPGAELASSLGEWGSRAFYVIDGAGTIRARTHSLMEAVRHLEVLQLGSRDTA